MKGLRLEKGCDLLQVSSFVISLRPPSGAAWRGGVEVWEARGLKSE